MGDKLVRFKKRTSEDMELDELLRLAEKGNLEIMALQRAAFE